MKKTKPKTQPLTVVLALSDGRVCQTEAQFHPVPRIGEIIRLQRPCILEEAFEVSMVSHQENRPPTVHATSMAAAGWIPNGSGWTKPAKSQRRPAVQPHEQEGDILDDEEWRDLIRSLEMSRAELDALMAAQEAPAEPAQVLPPEKKRPRKSGGKVGRKLGKG